MDGYIGIQSILGKIEKELKPIKRIPKSPLFLCEKVIQAVLVHINKIRIIFLYLTKG